jgi:tetratricopeptide (TPR) repeat protein
VLKLDPKSASAYVNLGVVYMRTERFDAAIKALESAKRLAPSVAGIDLNLGLAYYRKKDYSAAIPHFAQVLRADAGNYQARYLKGMCHFVQDEYQPAVDTLEPIASQQPDDIDLLFVLGICYGKLKRAAESEKAFARLVASGSHGLRRGLKDIKRHRPLRGLRAADGNRSHQHTAYLSAYRPGFVLFV